MELTFVAAEKDQGSTLYSFLRSCGVSASLIKKVKYHGQGFWADGSPVHTDYRLTAGQTVRFSLLQEEAATVEPQPIPVTVAYEDDFALVLDKPAGLAVHPTFNYPRGTLANGYAWLMQQQGRAAVFRPVNRLDKDTSGLVLCARSQFAAPALAQSAQKEYFAIVQGELPLESGGCRSINAPIARRGDSIIGRCVSPEGKPSVTRYQVLAAAGGHSLVRCQPVTGRTHQIRVHFAHLGHPLAGDDLYGGSRALIARQALHCGVMRFTCPGSGQPRCVYSPIPEDMRAFAALFASGFCLEKLPIFGQPLA